MKTTYILVMLLFVGQIAFAEQHQQHRGQNPQHVGSPSTSGHGSPHNKPPGSMNNWNQSNWNQGNNNSWHHQERHFHHYYYNTIFTYPAYYPYYDYPYYVTPSYPVSDYYSTQSNNPYPNGTWVNASNGSVPEYAAASSDDNGNTTFYCRVQYNNQIYYGTLTQGDACYVSDNNNSVTMRFENYQVLVNNQ